MISAGGGPVSTAQDLQRLMIGAEVGTPLPVTVYRKGALVDVIAELSELRVR
jgi:S1-C subfamily serine protease